jgi:putative FmdB family regulatory protein
VPSYAYVCQDCGSPFTIRVSIAEYSKGVRPRCTECGSTNAVRSLGTVNVLTGSRATGGGGAACGPSGFT